MVSNDVLEKTFFCSFHNIFRLDTFCTYSCIGTSGKKNQKTPMRGFFDPKPLQRVFDWVPFSLERSPIYSPATVNLNKKT